MEIFVPDFSLDRFFQSISQSPAAILMLDYDGTLSPFQVQRNQAFPYPGVRERLRKLIEKTSTRVIIISGRPIEDLKALLGLEPSPELWGSHGAERYSTQSGYHIVSLAEDTIKGLAEIESWASEGGLMDVLEKKPVGVAFHWRGLPEKKRDTIERQVISFWGDSIRNMGLEMHCFDGGIEIRPVGITKARAVEEILKQAPEQAICAYLGDDTTDEDAFRALDTRGLRILVRENRRPTQADIRIAPPGELLDFLDSWYKAAIVAASSS